MSGEEALITKGKKNYIAGIKRIGDVEKYAECGAKGGMKTATCLKAAKVKAATAEKWGKKWADHMGGDASEE